MLLVLRLLALQSPIFPCQYKQHRAYAQKYIVPPFRSYIYHRRHLSLHCFEQGMYEFADSESSKQSVNKRLPICSHFFTLLSPAVCYTATPVLITSSYNGEGRSSAIKTGSIKKLTRRVSDHRFREISIFRSPYVGTITATSISLSGFA